MMDLKTFSQADFDPKIWINKAWSSSGNQEKEVFVANAVSRLQLYMKQLTNSLDETTTQIVTSLPRVVRDAELVREEGLMLQQRLLALEERVEQVEEQTGHSIVSLQRIDKLKSKLENAASTLHEADKWAALTASLENILEVGVPPYGDKLNELSDQVTAMTQSLEVLSESSDYDSKRVHLETLYNRLEAAISAPMIDAISQMDPVRTCAYVRLVSGMGRRGAAGGAWRRAAAARLAADWRRIDAPAQPALTRLLASCAPTQIDWLTNVLQSETPLTELIRLYTDLLLSLDPSPSKVASAALKECTTAEEGVNFLIDLRRAIDEFVTTIKGIIDAPRPHQETIKSDVTQQLIRTAYLPLKNVVTHYATFENQLLQAKIGDLDQDDLVENSRAVLSVAQRCEAWLEAAYHRGRKIGARAVYPLYIQAAQEFVSMLTNVISSCARRVEATFLSSVSAGRATGVLSDAFAAALLLESAATTLLDAVVARHEAEAQDTESKEPAADVFDSLFDEGASHPAVDRGALSRTRDQLATLARNILKEPVETQLEKIPVLSAWSNNDALSTDLPDFALSPQEYITEIGQYVMTLPLHLEMLVADKQAEWQYLSEVCVHTCDAYAQKILTIRSMDQLGTRRCLTDIAYLSSVVEDLGSSVTQSLRSLESSLRAAAPDVRSDHPEDTQ